MIKIRKADAIRSLVPGAEWTLRDGVLEWFSKDIQRPTDKEIETELVRLQQEYDNKQYQRDRVDAYPSIGDQLDALFKAGLFPEEMAAQIQAIKDKYPKG